MILHITWRGYKLQNFADQLSRPTLYSEVRQSTCLFRKFLQGSLGRAFSKKISKDQIRVIRTPDQNVVKSLPNIDDSAQQAEDGRKRDRLIWYRSLSIDWKSWFYSKHIDDKESINYTSIFCRQSQKIIKSLDVPTFTAHRKLACFYQVVITRRR